MGDGIRISWELNTTAEQKRAWEIFSDTDRFNRSANVGYSYTEQERDDGTIEKTGHIHRLGVHITWEEKPFQYQEPNWFRSVRDFHNGPASRLTATGRLQANTKGDGTRLLFTVEVTPRWAILTPVLLFELKVMTRPQLDKALNAMLSLLHGESTDYNPAPPPLPPEVLERVETDCASLESPEFGRQLLDFLTTAPLRDQDRIRPLQVADAWSLDPNSVIDCFLEATRKGLLSLHWDVMCPSCRGPKDRTRRLMVKKLDVHCYSCNISFSGNLAESTEVTFRTSENIRDFLVGTACAGSPAHQRHVKLQHRLEPGQSESFVLDLEAGTYRLRTYEVGGPRGAWFELNPIHVSVVSGEEGDSTAIVVIDETGLNPSELTLCAGPCALQVSCRAPLTIEWRLDQDWRPPFALTAGQLLQREGVSDLLPEKAMASSFDGEVRRVGVVAAVALRNFETTITEIKPLLGSMPTRRIHLDSRRLVATFSEPKEALAAAMRLSQKADVGVSLAIGTVVELGSGEDGVSWGEGVDQAQSVLPAGRPGHVVIPASLAETGELRPLLSPSEHKLSQGSVVVPGIGAPWVLEPVGTGESRPPGSETD